MPERPILALPRPRLDVPPKGPRGGGKPKLPTRDAQVARFGPEFRKLHDILARDADSGMELREDPTSLAPDRVIVFEIAGTVADFARALAKVPGLDLMAEYETEEPPDERFAEMDTRKGHEGQTRDDRNVAGRFYLAMPNVAALSQLVSLWARYSRGEELGSGLAPFKHVFAQLRNLRPWGAQDRVPDETISYWREELQHDPERPVRTEVELWFYGSQQRRTRASHTFSAVVTAAGGTIVHEAVIPEIAYHGMLIDIPAVSLPGLMERREVEIALADDVMFLRPQSILSSPLEMESVPGHGLDGRLGRPGQGEPVAALFDGVPLQGHVLLADRLMLDDPDDLQGEALVHRRFHGTAMASLILHGDLNDPEPSLDRPLYVRPLMIAPAVGDERTPNSQLLVDMIYRAVLRLKGSEAQLAEAPSVFIVNISLGDPRRPFTRMVSPLARILDFLAVRYNVLFLVSAGNVTTPLALPEFNTWRDFENADSATRERAVLAALNATKHERTLLSPAEALNALTIGAHHHDNVRNRVAAPTAVDPFDDFDLPNPSCALGLGFHRTVKPDIYLPGGREHLRMRAAGGGVVAGFGAPQRIYGMAAAAPDTGGLGRTDRTAFSDGTSSATALATRAAHRIFDSLMDRDGGSLFAHMPAEFYAVVIKALLVHRAQWTSKAELLKEICGPAEGRQFVARSENAARFLGFGIPNVAEVLSCASNRATLLGYSLLGSGQAHDYRIPLPPSLEGVTDPRILTVTVAWFSPIRAGYYGYRCAKLEAAPAQPRVALGADRTSAQPADASVRKGTVFHERFSGSRAVPFIDDGHLALRLWCKDDTAGADQRVRYALAVTLETGTPIAVYEEIQQRLRVRPRPAP